MAARPALGRATGVLAGSALVLLTIGSCLQPPEPDAGQWDEGTPRLAAYGDSFTAGGGFAPETNWATGSAPGSHSVLQRLRENHPDAAGFSGAFAGARMQDLPTQVFAGPAGADVVMILLGLNDVCIPEPPYDPARFARDARNGLAAVQDHHPGAAITLFAIPDVTQLHDLHATVPDARDAWQAFPFLYCGGVLGGQATTSMIEDVRGDVMMANGVLEREALRLGVDYSAATLSPGFSLSELSATDYFHPNELGERRLADLAWDAVPVWPIIT